jgi:WG containing repeat
MKKLFLLLFLFYVSISFAQTRYLIPYRNGDLWGYADTNRHIVISPKYDEATIYFHGYATIAKGKLYGVINSKGKEIIPPQYNGYIEPWNDYLAVSRGKNTGIIHLHTGKVILPLSYLNISAVIGNIFIINGHDQVKGLFDAASRKWLLGKEYEDISWENISSGFTYFIARKKGNAIHFSISDKGHFAIIKKAPGKTAVPKKEAINPSTSVEETIEEIKEMEPDSNYIAMSGYIVNGKSGFYTTTFKNGVSATDSTPAIFDNIRFAKGNADLIVRKEGKEGVITLRNKEIVPLMYDEVKDVDSTAIHGIYIVKKNGKYGLARADKLLLPCNYDTITERNGQVQGFILRQNNKQGAFIYDKQRKLYDILIRAEYDDIRNLYAFQAANFNRSVAYELWYENSVFMVYISKNNKQGFVDLKGNEFFRD